MYCVVPQNSFIMTRGDTVDFNIPIYEGDGALRTLYEIQPTDIIYVGIMECNQPFEQALIRKKISEIDGTQLRFQLLHTDTENLLTGKYFITAKLVKDNTSVTTILPLMEFWITGTDRNGGVC